MHELRFLAYNDMPPHEFSISVTDTRNRLMAIEKLWKAGTATSALETAFLDARHERHHQPRCFVAREAYLGLFADGQVSKLADHGVATMDKAAEVAKKTLLSIESLYGQTVDQLDDLGLDRSVGELLEAEVENALNNDPSLSEPTMFMGLNTPSSVVLLASDPLFLRRSREAASPVSCRAPNAPAQSVCSLPTRLLSHPRTYRSMLLGWSLIRRRS